MKRLTGFKITKGKGFHIIFANGWGVSVQFGPGNYCENYDGDIGKDETASGEGGSWHAECAILDPKGGLFRHPSFDGDTVGGWKSPEDVLKLLQWASEQEATNEYDNKTISARDFPDK